MRLFALSLLCSFVLGGSLRAREQVEVFVLAGQSNATGQGRVDRIPEAWRGVEEAWLFHSPAMRGAGEAGVWKPVQPCSESPDRFGMELGFARRMLELRPGRRVALIKHAFSGSSLRTDWNPGQDEADRDRFGPHFATLQRTVAAGLDQLRQQGHTPVLRAVLWQQGEAEARENSPEDFARDYDLHLAHFLHRLREDWGSPRLPLVYGQVLPRPVGRMAHRDLVRAAQQRLDEGSLDAHALPGALLVHTDDLSLRGEETDSTHPGDLVHLGTEGNLELGRRMADRWMRWQQAQGQGGAQGAVECIAAGRTTGWRSLSAGAGLEVGPDAVLRCGGPQGAVIRSTARARDFELEFQWRQSDPAARLMVVPRAEALPEVGEALPAGLRWDTSSVGLQAWPAWNRARLRVQGGTLASDLPPGPAGVSSRPTEGAQGKGAQTEGARPEAPALGTAQPALLEAYLCFAIDRGQLELRGVRRLDLPAAPGAAEPPPEALRAGASRALRPVGFDAASLPEGWTADSGRLRAEDAAGPWAMATELNDYALSFDVRWPQAGSTRRWPVLGRDGSREADAAGRARWTEAPDPGEWSLRLPGLDQRWLQFSGHPSGSAVLASEAAAWCPPQEAWVARPGQWARVEIQRAGGQLSIQVDGRRVARLELRQRELGTGELRLVPGRGNLELCNLFLRTRGG